MTTHKPALFELKRVHDNPLYEGFASASRTWESPSLLGRESFEDDLIPGFTYRSIHVKWRQARLAKVWTPLKVIGRVSPFNDNPWVDGVPAFSQRACDSLRDLLKPNGELLPLDSDVGVPYYLYNITTISDALDMDRSICSWVGDSYVGGVDYFEFHKKRLAGLSIFRIRQYPAIAVVTEDVVRRVEQEGLNGFDFVRIWPHKRGTNWRIAGRRYPKARKATAKLKRHTLVVSLPLAGKKPNAAERKTVNRFMGELDAQLSVTSLTAPYFGSLEGHEKAEGEVRLFLSCPDVDKCVAKLEPWLEALDWPRPYQIAKRYGEIHEDNDAKETVLTYKRTK